MLELHRQLLRLRRDEPALSDFSFPAIEVEHEPDARWIVVRRAGQLAIAANMSGLEHTLPVTGRLILATAPVEIEAGLTMPPWSAAIVRQQL